MSDIDKALIAAYTAGAFSLPTEYENYNDPDNPLPPTDNTAWARLWHVPARTTAATLGSAGKDEHTGFLQIDLNYPRGTGDGAAKAKAEAILAYFKIGASFTHNSQAVLVSSNGRSQGRNVDGWYRISLTIYYRARVTR